MNNAHMFQMFDDWRNHRDKFSDASYYTIHKHGQITLLDLGNEQNEAIFKQMKKYKESYPNYIYALTMGLGKTILMGTCIFYPPMTYSGEQSHLLMVAEDSVPYGK